MTKLIATLFLTLTQVVTPCNNCDLNHPIIQNGYVVEMFGNSAIFEVHNGELIEWYLGDEPTSITVGDSVTIVDCELLAVNGKTIK